MAKKKSKSPLMVMKHEDVEYRRRLLVRWDFLCVVCGRGFTNLACVTKEHVIPRSETARISKFMKIEENIAPSHHSCNKLRGVGSLIETAKLVDQKCKTMRYREFIKWLNAPVPHRIVPDSAKRPVREPACLELPEWVPGMCGRHGRAA
jgi:hypothetical protein